MFSRSFGGLGGAFQRKERDPEDPEDPQMEYIPRDDGKKDDLIPTWRPKVTFEAWKSTLKHWMEEVKYSEHQYITRLFFMLQGKDVAEEVKEFTIKLGERRSESRDTVEKILEALQEKFGETEEEQYRRKVENFRKFSYKGKAEEALEEIDDIRYEMRELMELDKEGVELSTVDKNFEKLFTYLLIE